MNLKIENEMSVGKWEGNNPWLGLSTYQEGTRLYGRDTEVSTLMDIVCNNLAMVVFGRSGIGKSSLIHAGIFPEIRKKGMMPIYIRLEHNTDTSYIQQIENTICKELKNEDILGEQVPQMGLWDFFHRNIFYNQEHQQIVPVIFIDQFEEIYTLADAEHKHLAKELFEELADLLNNVKPAKVMAFEDEVTKFTKSKVDMGGDDVLTFRISKKRLNYVDDGNFHLVICLREDYLYYLERNTSKIPAFKVNRFSLQALDRKSAEDVIILPRAGLFSASEADDIISKISMFNDEGKEEIDPTILSIFLFKYFNSKGNVKTDNIISEFYADETHNISRFSLAYLENNLITGEGFRHIVPYNDALANGVKKPELDQLIASRILTVETRKKHSYIEFSHDVICPIAKEHRDRRKIEEQTRKLKMRILAATGLIFFAIILIGSFLYLYHLVAEKDRYLTITQTVNNSNRAHYMIVQGDVLNAIKLLLNIVPDVEEKSDYSILPETERILNEAYDSLYSDYACISILKHQDDVTTAEYSEDTKYIVTASNDGICRIWNGRSSEKIQELKSDFTNMTAASMNRDGSQVITSFDNDSILIWDVTSGHIEKVLTGHTASVNHTCFSPDGQYALSASDDKTVRLWDVETCKCLDTLKFHADNVNCALFNSDGTKVITASEDGTSIVYDINSKSSRKVYSKEDTPIEYAEFNYNDSKIAIVTDNAVYVINAESTNTEAMLTGHDDLITSASFSPNGKMIATSSRDKTIKLWEVSTEKLLHTYRGHSNIIKKVVFSPDGNSLLSTSTDDEARIWNTDIRDFHSVIHSEIGSIASITYSPNGQYIAAVSVMGEARIWDIKDGDTISAFSIPEKANSIAFNKCGDKVAITSECAKIRVYDVMSGQLTDSVKIPDVKGYDYALFADNDKSIYAYSKTNRSIRYSLNSHSYKYIIEPNEDSLCCLAFGNDSSNCLISSYADRSFSVWNIEKESRIKTFVGHSKEVCSMDYSHDEKQIISGSSDNTAIIWDAETASVVHKLKKHSSQVYFAEFSYDGRYAITVSDDKTVKVWNTLTGEDVASKNISNTPKYTYMFSPNAPMYIIAGESDIHIYKLNSPKELLFNFRNRYRNIEFTQEEKEYYSIK